MSTLAKAKPRERRLQVILPEEAYLRIKSAAASCDLNKGQFIAKWALEKLPAVEAVAV